MFSDLLIAFLAGAGFAGWVYAKLMRSTGGNTSNSVIVAGGSGFILFLAIMIFLSVVF